MFCKYDWKVLSETTSESQLEHFINLTGKFQPPNNSIQMKEMTRRKHICILTCSKCGKLERFIEEI